MQNGQRQTTSDLGLPAQIVVWTLRTAATQGGLDTTLPCLRRIFGPADVERIGDAFREMLSALTRPHTTLAVGAHLAQFLSDGETILLQAIRAIQRGNSCPAIAWPGVPASRRKQLETAIELVANHLLALGYAVELPQTKPAALTDTIRSIPCALNEISPTERTLINAIRCWVAAIKSDQPHAMHTAHQQIADQLGDGAHALDAILGNLAATATRSIDIRCKDCEGLSQDERTLLNATAAAQNRHMSACLVHLMAFLPRAAARQTLAPLSALADALRVRRLRLVPPAESGAGRQIDPSVDARRTPGLDAPRVLH
ncbi:MAG: hypothetical protein K0U93_28465 [Gammaproteobacteria bacterium]|nr:hypothetical protein [Gammaproteobacteria bacterium]